MASHHSFNMTGKSPHTAMAAETQYWRKFFRAIDCSCKDSLKYQQQEHFPMSSHEKFEFELMIHFKK